MFFPIFPADPGLSADLRLRVKNLETALTLSFGLLKTLVQRLEDRLGPGVLGPELNQLIQSQAEIRQQVRHLDELVASGNTGTAARVCRELTGMTWDEAHDLIEHWNNHPFEKKLQWIEAAHWMKTLNSVADAGGKEPSSKA
jgi:hypothetical protein